MQIQKVSAQSQAMQMAAAATAQMGMAGGMAGMPGMMGMAGMTPLQMASMAGMAGMASMAAGGMAGTAALPMNTDMMARSAAPVDLASSLSEPVSKRCGLATPHTHAYFASVAHRPQCASAIALLVKCHFVD